MTTPFNPDRPDSGRSRAGVTATLLICLLVLLLGVGLTVLIFSTEPEPQRTAASIQTAMPVRVTRAKHGDFRPVIEVMGTVRAVRDITLRPRVGGEIVELADSFIPGGAAEKGEPLLRIDPRDYEIALQRAQSDLRRAVADLELEKGRQEVARKDYNLLEEPLTPENRALVLRKPQLSSARAEVESARAALERAKLDLERTRIEAPFDARVVSREVNVGSQVSSGDELARLVGTDTYWVQTTVPLDKLSRISVPDSPKAKGARVRIRDRTAWPEGAHRTGRLDSVVGTLEEDTRMARVLVSIEDPLARRTNGPQLMLGSYVRARIRGRTIRDVVRLNRNYVRKANTVWVMETGRLDVREVGIAFTDRKYAYIDSGLGGGDQVVVSHLATVKDGARLRLKDASASGGTRRQDNPAESRAE